MLNDFAVFILTHGRPENIITLTSLKKSGYTGRLYLIIDDEDKAANSYRVKYGSDSVIMFSKKEMADKIDEGNNFDERRTITHARNACFEIARELGVTYFIQLDDDYTSFDYRLIVNGAAVHKNIKDINKVFESLLTFYKGTQALSIAWAQGGDFIGGLDNGKDTYRFARRKCMNTFICSTEREFQFTGTFNEDVNTYTVLGSRGNLFMTIPIISITQRATQSQAGGITEAYKKYGTYCKAFSTVMMQPSSVTVAMMRANNIRLHHRIDWPTTVPVILPEKYQKAKSLYCRELKMHAVLPLPCAAPLKA